MNNRERIDQLYREHSLSHADWQELIARFSEEDRQYAQNLAGAVTKTNFGNRIFFRGLIEFSNICKNDCLYCGIRCSNKNIERYCLSEEEILACCDEGYRLGYRTFVLQSGENDYVTSSQFLDLIRKIKHTFPDCAVTLSVGECSKRVYEEMFAAGVDRYLLRQETANKNHYAQLHPSGMSFDNRMQCLRNLKDIGFQTGCGMMVGTPYQTPDTLAEDMQFMAEFKPAMVGMGVFLPHKDTPFADCTPGDLELTLFLLSLTRIMLPNVLLPATTALGTFAQDGYQQGILAGCNVVMPNLSPQRVRKNYMLYDNKIGTVFNAQESLKVLRQQIETVGRRMVVERGDYKEF